MHSIIGDVAVMNISREKTNYFLDFMQSVFVFPHPHPRLKKQQQVIYFTFCAELKTVKNLGRDRCGIPRILPLRLNWPGSQINRGLI